MFESFPKASYADWKNQVEKELKGKAFEDFLNWNFQDFKFPAYQSAESIAPEQTELSHQVSQLVLATDGSWKAEQRIVVKDAQTANSVALTQLRTGVDKLHFIIQSPVAFDVLFTDIQRDIIQIDLEFDYGYVLSEDFELPADIAESSSIRCLTNPWNQLARFPDTMAQAPQLGLKMPAGMHGFIVDASDVLDAGGSLEQQLHFALAGGLHLEQWIQKQKSAFSIRFHFGVSPTYFPEIAKLRAFRWLWHNVSAGVAPYEISSTGSLLFTALVDEQNNTLRSTTSTMAALLGGSQSHRICWHNEKHGHPDFFASRIANNIHHILREESFFGQNADPVFGSFYIDYLTLEICERLLEKDWKTDAFPELASGSFQKEVQGKGKSLQEAIYNGKAAWLGVNLFRNESETTPEILEPPIAKGALAPLVLSTEKMAL